MGKCVSQICYHDANGEREVIMRYPKIGIRPVIDGRWGGVRESLENQGDGFVTVDYIRYRCIDNGRLD